MDQSIREEFRLKLHERGLGRHADALADLVEPSIRLTCIETLPDDAVPLGRTRLGGLADVPAGFEWPRFNGLPQSFIAQINLDEVAALDHDKVLPSTGLLTFFYAAIDQPWGFDPADRGGWQVTYTPPGTPLVRLNPPADLAAEGRFTGVAVKLVAELTFAPLESAVVERVGLTEDDRWGYIEVVELFETRRDGTSQFHRPMYRLLGHPDPVQGDMQLECQMASNGVNFGYRAPDREERERVLGPGATDWRLLLQIDSGDAPDMEWGDTGRIYYWIRAQDLAARRFNRVWLVLQCS